MSTKKQKNGKPNKRAVRTAHRSNTVMSYLGFTARCEINPKTDESFIEYALCKGITKFQVDAGIIEQVHQFKWRWEVEVFVQTVKDVYESMRITVGERDFFKLSDLNELCQDVLADLIADVVPEGSDYISHGWTAVIKGSPV